MDDLGKYISAALALCFLCTVAYFFGEMIGLGQPRLLDYFSFSDFVDAAPVVVGSMIMYLGWSLWNDEKHRIQNNYTKQKLDVAPLAFLVIALGWGAICAAIYFFWDHTVAGVIFFLGLIGYVLWIEVLPTFRKPENDKLIDWIERGSWMVMLAVLVGVFIGRSKFDDEYTITTDNKVFVAQRIVELGRGVAILQGSGFVLVPWSEVKSLAYTNPLQAKLVVNPGPRKNPK